MSILIMEALEGLENIREHVQHADETSDVPLLPFRPIPRNVPVIDGKCQIDRFGIVRKLSRTVENLLLGEQDFAVGFLLSDIAGGRIYIRSSRFQLFFQVCRVAAV